MWTCTLSRGAAAARATSRATSGTCRLFAQVKGPLRLACLSVRRSTFLIRPANSPLSGSAEPGPASRMTSSDHRALMVVQRRPAIGSTATDLHRRHVGVETHATVCSACPFPPLNQRIRATRVTTSCGTRGRECRVVALWPRFGADREGLQRSSAPLVGSPDNHLVSSGVVWG
jgi:hypothetical protein